MILCCVFLVKYCLFLIEFECDLVLDFEFRAKFFFSKYFA